MPSEKWKRDELEKNVRNDYGDGPGAGGAVVALVAFGILAVAVVATLAWIFS